MSKQILRWTVVLSKFRYLQIITGWVQADTQNICINWDCPRIEKYVDIFNASYCTFIIVQIKSVFQKRKKSQKINNIFWNFSNSCPKSIVNL